MIYYKIVFFKYLSIGIYRTFQSILFIVAKFVILPKKFKLKSIWKNDQFNLNGI